MRKRGIVSIVGLTALCAMIGTPLAEQTQPLPPAQPVPLAESRPGVEITARAEDPQLVDMAIARGIEDRKPTDPGDTHPGDVGRLYCWTVVKNGGEPTKVRHVWRQGERTVTEISVSVGKSSAWHTWSIQPINPARTGAWSCEVFDEAGTSLGKATVTVQ